MLKSVCVVFRQAKAILARPLHIVDALTEVSLHQPQIPYNGFGIPPPIEASITLRALVVLLFLLLVVSALSAICDFHPLADDDTVRNSVDGIDRLPSWRRTVDGWERSDQWQTNHAQPVRSRNGTQLHPLIVAIWQVLISLTALLVLPACAKARL